MFTAPSQFREVVSNTAWLAGDRLLRLGLGALVTIVVARWLGPEQFGALTFCVSLLSILGPLVGLGLELIVVRELVRAPESRADLLPTVIVMKLLGAVVSAIGGLLIVYLLRPNDTQSLTITAILCVGLFAQMSDVFDLWLQATRNNRVTVLCRNSAFLFFAIVKVLLVYAAAPLLAFAAVMTGETVVAALLLWIFGSRSAGQIDLRKASFSRASELLKESFPFILAGFCVAVYMRSDTILLALLINDAAVGLYAAAVRISEIWYFLPTALLTSTFPFMVASARHDDVRSTENRVVIYGIMFWLAVVIALLFTIFSSFLILILFGPNYREASVVLAIHSWAAIPIFLGVSSSQYLVSEHLSVYSFYRTLAGLVANIILNLSLIPAFGIMGAAIATTMAYFVATFSLLLFNATRQHALLMCVAPFMFVRLLRGTGKA